MISGWSQVKIQDYNQQPFNIFLPQASSNSNQMSSYGTTTQPSQCDIVYKPATGIQAQNLTGNTILITEQRSTASSGFMPGAKPNRYMNMLKKNQTNKTANILQQQKQKRQISTTNEDQKNRRQRMRKYLDKKITPGYKAVVELNGGETLGERDRKEIDEYLGIGITNEGANEVTFHQNSQGQVLGGPTSIKKLQDEQRDIEAKLKFIDGLINQQQAPAMKYFGGGILKKHTTEDFVVNLEQYQRAMEDIRKTMDSIHGQKPQNNRNFKLVSGNNTSQSNRQVTTMKSFNLEKTPPSQNLTAQKYYAQYEEMIGKQPPQQILNQRQVLSVIPTLPNHLQEEVDKVSMSSHYTNDARLYDPTLMRQSLDSNHLRHSIKSASFASAMKLDYHTQNATEAIKPLLESPNRETTTPNTDNRQKSKKTSQPSQNPNSLTVSQNGLNVAPEIVVTSERLLSGTHAPVIEDTREETTIDRDDKEESDIEELRNDNQQHIMIQNEARELGMAKVDLVFEQELNHKPFYESKMYKARTQVTNPMFKQKNFTIKQAISKPEPSIRTSLEKIQFQQKHVDNLGKLPQPDTKPIMKETTIEALRKSPIRVPREVLALHAQGSRDTDTNMERVASQKTISMHQPTATNLDQNLEQSQLTDNPLPSNLLNLSPSPKSPYKNTQKKELIETHQQIEDKRLTEMGKKAIQLNRQSQSRLEVLDNSVIYQQDGDMSKGVLYFKNLDSLKEFILNKKRPIYSRKGNKIFQTEDAITGFKLTRNHDEYEDEKTRSIKADIVKKRQYLHKTLTNLMPQIQLRSLQQKTQQSFNPRPNFQQTIDLVSKKVLEQSENKSQFNTSPSQNAMPQTLTINGNPREMTWAPIQNIQQYPFEDMMNPDGIIDLRILGTITPVGIVIPTQHIRTFSRQDIGSAGTIMHVRSESSPGVSRNHSYGTGPRQFSQMSKRLQTFYGISTMNNTQQQQEGIQNNQSTGNLQSRNKRNTNTNKKLNHHESEQSIGTNDSNDTNSSHQTNTNNQRQIVFFKTSSSMQLRQDNPGGSYMVMQYPHLRPRLLNNQVDISDMQSQTMSKPMSHTVAMHQQYIRSAESMANSFQPNMGNNQVLSRDQQQRAYHTATSPGKARQDLLKMSRGIEISKIKTQNQTSNKIPDDSKNTQSSIDRHSNESDQVKIPIQSQQQQQRKHVIFSTFEGKPQTSPIQTHQKRVQPQALQTTKNKPQPKFTIEDFHAEKKLNLPMPPTNPFNSTQPVASKIPPIHPNRSVSNNNLAAQTNISSRPLSRKSESRQQPPHITTGAMIAGSFFGINNSSASPQFTDNQMTMSQPNVMMPPLRSSQSNLITSPQGSNIKRPPAKNENFTSTGRPRMQSQESTSKHTVPSLQLYETTQSAMSSLKGLTKFAVKTNNPIENNIQRSKIAEQSILKHKFM